MLDVCCYCVLCVGATGGGDGVTMDEIKAVADKSIEQIQQKDEEIKKLSEKNRHINEKIHEMEKLLEQSLKDAINKVSNLLVPSFESGTICTRTPKKTKQFMATK